MKGLIEDYQKEKANEACHHLCLSPQRLFLFTTLRDRTLHILGDIPARITVACSSSYLSPPKKQKSQAAAERKSAKEGKHTLSRGESKNTLLLEVEANPICLCDDITKSQEDALPDGRLEEKTSYPQIKDRSCAQESKYETDWLLLGARKILLEINMNIG